MARVLVTEEIAETGLDLLHAAGHEVDVRSGLDADGLVAALDGASALIIRSATQVTAEVLDAVEGLVVVGRAGIGLDNVDVRAATRRGVMVVNAPLSNSVSAAEHTMALLLAQARNIPQAHGDLVAGEWNRSTWKGVELADKTLGIVGMGRIGLATARRAAGFGMDILYTSRSAKPDAEQETGAMRVELDELLARSDFVSVHVALSDETTHMIGARELSLMRETAFLINTARGPVVDEAALVEALRDGDIAGAGLDVYEEEPVLAPGLMDLPNTVLLPHVASATIETRTKMAMLAAENAIAVIEGRTPTHLVNPTALA